MDAKQARDELRVARRASTAGTIPRLDWWIPVVIGLLVAVAITLAGWASTNGWWHLAELAGAVLVAGAAVLVLHTARRRRGVHGLRGPARKEWAATLVSAIAFFVVATGATAQGRVIYAGLGLVAGTLTAALLYARRS